MLLLQIPRHGAFPQGRATVASLQEAFKSAGFASDRAKACPIAKQDDVAARVAEPRQAREMESLATAVGQGDARLARFAAHHPRVGLSNSKILLIFTPLWKCSRDPRGYAAAKARPYRGHTAARARPGRGRSAALARPSRGQSAAHRRPRGGPDAATRS